MTLWRTEEVGFGMDKQREEKIKEAVRAHYTASAKKSGACCGGGVDARALGYTDQEISCLPAATGSSLGCGNPLGFCELQEGQVVLDLGSGLGIDVILAARQVGPTGKVIGLDMTPEMIDRATRNAANAGVQDTVEFRLGGMEDMPVEDASVDWIISNCVINLSPDKQRAFQEAYRVLKPGGQMVVSDLVSSGLPDEWRTELATWASCLGGTIEEAEYLRLIEHAGFHQVAVVEKVDATAAMLGEGCCGPAGYRRAGLTVDSIRVRAVKG
jgi:arsenite methyltransferase